MSRGQIAAIGAAAALIAGTTGACSHSRHQEPARQPAASSPAAPGIYSLLPFSQQQLDAAYISAARASAAYETFSYTDTPAAYGSRIAPWVSQEYRTYLEQTFRNTTATANRVRMKEHSSATSKIISIRTFGATSITFITEISQNDPVTSDSGNYAVTVATADGKHWLVSDIEPAAAGNS